MLSVGRFNRDHSITVYNPIDSETGKFLSSTDRTELTLGGVDVAYDPIVLRRKEDTFEIARGDIVSLRCVGSDVFIDGKLYAATAMEVTDLTVSNEMNVLTEMTIGNPSLTTDIVSIKEGVVYTKFVRIAATLPGAGVDFTVPDGTSLETEGSIVVGGNVTTSAGYIKCAFLDTPLWKNTNLTGELTVDGVCDFTEQVNFNKQTTHTNAEFSDRIDILSTESTSTIPNLLSTNITSTHIDMASFNLSTVANITLGDVFFRSTSSDFILTTDPMNQYPIHNVVTLTDERRLGVGTINPHADLHVVSGLGTTAALQVDISPMGHSQHDVGFKAIRVRNYNLAQNNYVGQMIRFKDGEELPHDYVGDFDYVGELDRNRINHDNIDGIDDVFSVSKQGHVICKSIEVIDNLDVDAEIRVDTIVPSGSTFVTVNGCYMDVNKIGTSLNKLDTMFVNTVNVTDLVIGGTITLNTSSFNVSKYDYLETVDGDNIHKTISNNGAVQRISLVNNTSVQNVYTSSDQTRGYTYKFSHESSTNNLGTIHIDERLSTDEVAWKMDQIVTYANKTKTDIGQRSYHSMVGCVYYANFNNDIAPSIHIVENVFSDITKERTLNMSLIGSYFNTTNFEYVRDLNGNLTKEGLHQTLTIGTDTVDSDYLVTIDGKISVAGEVKCTAVTNISDERLKKDIVPLVSGTEELMRLQPVSFSWKSSEEETVGFIAQSIEQVGLHPSLVSTDPMTGMKGIRTEKLIPYLVNAIQELTREVELLKREKN